jgi:hypothetical protein
MSGVTLLCSNVACRQPARFRVQYTPNGDFANRSYVYTCSIVCLLKWASRFSIHQGQQAVQKLLGSLPK